MKMQGIRVYQTFLRFLPYEILDSIVLLLRSSTKITNKKLKYSTIVARKTSMDKYLVVYITYLYGVSMVAVVVRLPS